MGAVGSPPGAGTCLRIVSNSGRMSVPCVARSSDAQPFRPDAYTTGKSSCSSVAPSLSKRSKVWLTTSGARRRSTLLTTTIGFRPARGFARHGVCGIFDGVDEQQHAIDHRQHALDLAAEIGVARGVDDVDVRAGIVDGRVLREDRDAAFALDVVRVHHAFGDVLVRGEGAGLVQQLVDQCRLAVVDVGDDRDIARRAHGTGTGSKKVAEDSISGRAFRAPPENSGVQRVRGPCVQRFSGPPSALRYMTRALLARDRWGRGAPFRSSRCAGRVTVDTRGDPAAIVYPHLFGFRLAMAMLTQPSWPLPPWRTMQVRNRLILHRAAQPVLSGAPRPRSAAGECSTRVWRSTCMRG